MAGQLFVGLMSGTSIDGIDAALVEFSGAGAPRLRAALVTPIPGDLRSRILSLTRPGDNEIDRMGELDVEIGRRFADAALTLLRKNGVDPEAVTAIGSHGQTIRHRPRAGLPFTLQIGDPNTIAEATGITTVADFRRRDIAAGGHGAPLVPAFHAAVFRHPDEDRVILNLGGMGNVTLLPRDHAADVRGFDTGPANVLLDAWHERHRDSPLDADGAWARSGKIHRNLLERLLQDPYFAEPPPKSTGREHFDADWLSGQESALRGIAPPDVQTTLVELTARSVADALERWGFTRGALYTCGGGTHNGFLRERLQAALPGMRLASTIELGVDPDHVEAMAFAWLAQRTLHSLAGNLPAVTGAQHPVILGGIYPGRIGRN
ncbi:MAG: anhydro-N-acetylmuramic acid kinase [Pseudomonadota bacterium]